MEITSCHANIERQRITKTVKQSDIYQQRQQDQSGCTTESDRENYIVAP